MDVDTALKRVGPLDDQWAVYLKSPLDEFGRHTAGCGMGPEAELTLQAARVLEMEGVATISHRRTASGTEYVIKRKVRPAV